MYIIKLRIHILIYSLFALNIIKLRDNIIRVVQVKLIIIFYSMYESIAYNMGYYVDYKMYHHHIIILWLLFNSFF